MARTEPRDGFGGARSLRRRKRCRLLGRPGWAEIGATGDGFRARAAGVASRIAAPGVAVVCLALLIAAAAATSACAARTGTAPADGDARLEARVEAALASAADVSAETLTVEAAGGVVTLSGRLASGTEQQSAGAIIRAVPGVRDVLFSLTIDDPGARP